MEKPSKIQAIVQCKCPHCRQGDVFKAPAISTRFTQTYEHCPVCNVRYEPEPAFFYGAMFVGYGFSVGLVLVLGFATFYLLNDPPISTYLGIIIGATILSVPFNFRYSRVLFLYWFSGISYDENWRLKTS